MDHNALTQPFAINLYSRTAHQGACIMKTTIILALAIALAPGIALAQGGPSGGSQARPVEADPKAGLPASGTISSEAQAKTRLEAQGYRNVSQLVKRSDGLWHGTAVRNALPVGITVDARGKITTR
jgi:periplasmic protein CpxP/Spy